MGAKIVDTKLNNWVGNLIPLMIFIDHDKPLNEIVEAGRAGLIKAPTVWHWPIPPPEPHPTEVQMLRAVLSSVFVFLPADGGSLSELVWSTGEMK